MQNLKAWILAARLRTLPLSISGVVVGTALANEKGLQDPVIFTLAILTTIAFQITSNLANDYGDGTKGTDGAGRLGPDRALESGLLTPKQLKMGVYALSCLSLLLSIWLLATAFGSAHLDYFAVFIFLAVLSIWAAIRYTMGNAPYGYKGLGDVFVFLFFGLVAVLGSEFLYTKSFAWLSVLPAIAVGVLSVGVLNLNNLRDVESDRKHMKNTLVVKMGYARGKMYHVLLLIAAFFAMVAYTVLGHKSLPRSYYILAFVPIAYHLVVVVTAKNPKDLDPELKKLALSTFLMAILLYTAINYFF